MSLFGALLCLATACGARPSQALATEAWLSWSADSVRTDLSPAPFAATLFIRVRGATSYKGGEVDLVWSPPGDGTTCAANLGATFRTSTSCVYLNRGNVLPIVTTDVPGHLHVAWASNVANDDCGEGNAALVSFQLDGCPSPASCFTLRAMTILHGDNSIEAIDIRGADATLSGGADSCGWHDAAPVLCPIGPQTTVETHDFRISPCASDPDCDVVTYFAHDLPPGAQLANGVFTWRPAFGQIGSYDVTLGAADPWDGRDSEVVTISVGPRRHVVYVRPVARKCYECNADSWEAAESRISWGISLAAELGIDSVFVAEGDYSSEYQVVVVDGITLLGGFVAVGDERDPWQHRTRIVGRYGWSPLEVSAAGSTVDGFELSKPSGGSRVVYVTAPNTVLRNLRIDGSFTGDAITIDFPSHDVTIDHCLITGNRGQHVVRVGGASGVLVDRCTVTADSLYSYDRYDSASVFEVNTPLTLRNSIVWGVKPASIPLARPGETSLLEISYSDVQGGVPGTETFDADPLFVNAASADFRLKADSPCARRATDGGPIGALGVDTTTMSVVNPARGLHVPSVAATEAAVDLSALEGEPVAVQIVSTGGRIVRRLAIPSSGTAKAMWDLTDDRGRPVAAGVYFVVARTEKMTATARIVVVR